MAGEQKSKADIADCRRMAEDYIRAHPEMDKKDCYNCDRAPQVVVGGGYGVGSGGFGGGGLGVGMVFGPSPNYQVDAKPSKFYMDYVDGCLGTRGYEVTGWR
jgi:hypothetical protein